MDSLKTVKDMKGYTNELSELLNSITAIGTKVKVGKYKLIETPSVMAADRLAGVLNAAVESEYKNITDKYLKFEAAINEIQMDLFASNEENRSEENTLHFGSKVN